MKQPIKILDLGGTTNFWYQMGLANDEGFEITLLNLYKEPKSFQNIKSIKGDARRLLIFTNKQFDIVFSNSLIEHIGNLNSQMKLGKEIMRIGKKYFVQTPNRYFIIEPHFLIPLFFLIPNRLKVDIVERFSFKWWTKPKTHKKIEFWIKSIRLLDENEMRNIFSDCTLYKERFLGLTKSFIAHN